MDPEKANFQSTAGVASTNDRPRAIPSSSRTSSTISVHEHEHDIEKAADETIVAKEATQNDANLVDWDGPDDPEKPLNWSKQKKWTNMMIIAALTMLTPFGSTMFAPSVPEVMEEFHSDNNMLATFVVSIYVLGYILRNYQPQACANKII